MKKIIFLFLFLFAISINYSIAQKTPNLALTPPMGWNSWNTFEDKIDEAMIKEIVDVMISSGMKDAGYEYINLDDFWMANERDKQGNLQANSQKFPSGMKALGDYIHSKGFKFGIYNCAGTKTCGGLPGTRGHEYQDALKYAEWGVDYLKYDWCNTEGLNSQEAYSTMSKAIQAAGRPMVFSICEWGATKPWEWAEPIGHLWRTTGDIGLDWVSVDKGHFIANGIIKMIELQTNLRKYAGPGHWNDPDMLEVGKGLTLAEDRAHFSMWAMLAAPLIAGNDVRKMSKETVEILTNKEVIAIDQDSLGIQAFKYNCVDSIDTWVKPLQNGDFAVCFLNKSSQTAQLNFDWKLNIITDDFSKTEINANKATYKIKNIWTKKSLGDTRKTIKSSIDSHDVLMLKLNLIKQ